MVRRLYIAERNAAEKAMGHQTALYFMPNLAKAGIEFLSHLLFFHGVLAV
jgi:hypothetical protein